jgi:hypothetical protein
MCVTSHVLDDIADAVAGNGLSVRGAVSLAPGEWGDTRSVILIGNAGSAYWAHFQRWLDAQTNDLANPLDQWSRLVISNAADRFDGLVQMPNDKPYAPFQQWAMRAMRLRPSPLGLLIHPEQGLWHAFRGAILLEAEISIQAFVYPIHVCDACVGKPCIKACPVGAFDGPHFDYQACLSHVRGPEAGPCRTRCIARNACPVGSDYRYADEVQAFHQRAFAGL